MNYPKDIRGTSIVVGDHLAYAMNCGHSSVLRTFKVIGFTPTGLIRASHLPETYPPTVSALKSSATQALVINAP